MADPSEIVRRFCDVWAENDVDQILGFLSEDAVYHNMPLAPVTGHDAIRETINGFTALVDRIEFRVLNLAADGDVVLTERIDAFVFPTKTVELPVMGTFEVKGDKIVAWRDYFDLNQVMSQLPGT